MRQKSCILTLRSTNLFRGVRAGGQGGKCPPPPNFDTGGATPSQLWAKRDSFDLLHGSIFAHLAAINVKIFSRLRRAVHTFTTVLAKKTKLATTR